MNRLAAFWLILLFLCCSVSVHGLAQGDDKPYFITSYTASSGLSGYHCGAITEDEDGYIWIGTNAGLNRFNGYHFTVYKSDVYDTTSVTSNRINNLLTDHSGKIWVGGNGICTFDKKHNYFIQIPLLLKNGELERKFECLFLFQDSRKNIWAGTNGRGLLKYNPAKGVFQTLDAIASLPAEQRLQLPPSVSSVCEDHDGSFWLTSYTHLYHFDAALSHLSVKKNLLSESSGAKPFQAIKAFTHASDTNLLWITSWGSGLVLFDKISESFTSYRFENHLPSNISNIIFSFFRKDKNELWLGSNIGIIPFNETERTFGSVIRDQFTHNSIVNSLIRSIYKAKNGIIWIGSETGLSNLDPGKQHFIGNRLLTTQHSFYHIDPITEKLYATKVYFHRNLSIYDLKTKIQQAIPIPEADEKRAEPFLITGDRKGTIWIGTTKGIYTYHPKDNQIRKYNLSNDLMISGPEPYVYDMTEDADGNMWFLTSPYSLLRYSSSTQKFSQITYGNKVQDNPFEGAFRIAVVDSQTIGILSAQKGVIRINTQTLKVTVYNPVILNNRIFASGTEIAADRQHRIWITTESSGLICINEDGTIRYYNKDSQGDLVDDQSNLIIDHQGDIWLLSTKGLYRFNSRQQYFNLYNKDQGFPEIRQDTKLHLQSDGSITYNTDQGIFSFKPEQIKIAEDRLHVHLSSFAVNGKPSPLSRVIDQTDHIILNHDQNNLTFEYAAVNFRNPQATLYSYKLEGSQTDWAAPTANRLLNFYKLKPGEYELKIRAAVLNFKDDTPVKTIRITIVPAWYQTNLFMWLSGLSLVVLLALTIRYFISLRFRQKIMYMEHQGQLEQMRARISRDIHDEIGAGLTKIKLLGRALNKKPMPDETISQLSKKINDSSDELIQNLGEIVWTINPENDSMENVVAYMRYYLLKTFEGTPDITLHLAFPDAELVPKGMSVSPDVKRNLLLILKESVNNAMKHAAAKTVTITLNVSTDHIMLMIEDDGKGFDAEAVHPNGNGIKNMKKRAAAVHGSLTLETGIGRGTLIRMSIHLHDQ